MSRRALRWLAVVVFLICVVLVVLQGSFSLGDYAPTTVQETYLFWAVSTVIFLLMVALGFMLFRTAVRLYIERRKNREGAGIKIKMVVGALALSFLPVFFLVLFSVSVLNRNLDKWFTRPAMNVRLELVEMTGTWDRVVAEKAQVLAALLARDPGVQHALRTGVPGNQLRELCQQYGLSHLRLVPAAGQVLPVCAATPAPGATTSTPRQVTASAPVQSLDGEVLGQVNLSIPMPLELAERQAEIEQYLRDYDRLAANRKATRATYLLLLSLITLFILFVATWIALFLARQISVPISALLEAAQEIGRGNLSYRVQVDAIDELASLVRSFNAMTQQLEANAQELHRRQRFIEAILENIPIGVASLSPVGEIQIANRALRTIFPSSNFQRASRVEELFPESDRVEIRYLLNRARRLGVAGRQFEFQQDGRTLHLSVTVSTLEDSANAGFVVLVEDTTELLQAQKAAAWREVARRVAHELKNPLTPITLCAQRIARQVERLVAEPAVPSEETRRILQECAGTITQEVESVRRLVNEFTQFARFPAAQPGPAQLNEVIRAALQSFEGRWKDIQLRLELEPDLPLVWVDRDQFRRVLVNLIDNSVEAMEATPQKELTIRTRAISPEAVELVVADTGRGISAVDREKLFLPYFSTKERGTGLGLAIVRQILAEHQAYIRVEDNEPAGTRFIIEVPTAAVMQARQELARSGA